MIWSGGRLRARLRSAVIGYLAALLLNLSLVWGQPTPTLAGTPPPLVFTRREPLIDGCWSDREIFGGPTRYVISLDWSTDHEGAPRFVQSLN